MRRIPTLVTILITSFVMAISGLAASSVATASENETVTSSLSFQAGSSVLTKSQKASIKKVVTTAGTDATFQVTGTAGKLTGASDKAVQALAKNRGQAVKAYLVKLGVSKSNITTKVKITRLGIVSKTKLVGTYASATPTSTSTSTPTPTPTASPTPSPSPSQTVALTCATGGTCVVGDSGPGGGIVYYVDNAGFNCGASYSATGSPTGGLCHYLEVSPDDWNSIAATGDLTWSVSARQSADVPDLVQHDSDGPAYNNAQGIGLGYKNSDLIVVQGNDVTTAAGAARAYTNNGKSDWYLPTTAELNLLCQWNRGVTQNVSTKCAGGAINSGTGASGSGFKTSAYWSSSECEPNSAWFQTFYNGNQNYNDKTGTMYVRAVRAF